MQDTSGGAERSPTDANLRGGHAPASGDARWSAGHEQPAAGRPGRRRSSLLVWVLAGLIALALVQFLVPHFVEQIRYAAARGRQRAEVEIATAALKEFPLQELSRVYRLVSQRIAPSVVHINASQIIEAGYIDEMMFYLPGQQFESRSQGSGVIVDDDGYILTNYHVVQGASEISVGLTDGRIRPAKVVGADPLTDLAVLKINARGLISAEWGDSDLLEVGDLVWAVGSPYGLDHTVTSGILSAKDRDGFGIGSAAFHDFLQTDAAVNPGNSGGPLVNAEGAVVGINTAIVGESYRGISFAIPSDTARHVYDRLRTEGSIQRGYLGIAMQPVTEQNARLFGLDAPSGVYVERVIAGSPADRAGLEPGDVMLSWGPAEVNDPTQLARLIAATEIGNEVTIKIWRNGRERSLEVVVGQSQTR